MPKIKNRSSSSSIGMTRMPSTLFCLAAHAFSFSLFLLSLVSSSPMNSEVRSSFSRR